MEQLTVFCMNKPRREGTGFANSPAKQSKSSNTQHSAVDHTIKERKAVTLIDLGKLDEAEAIYKELIALKTHSFSVYANLAVICGMQSRFDDVIKLLHKALELNSNQPEVHNNLGAVQLQLGMATEAVVSHEKAIALQPNNAVSYCNLGNALRAQGKLKAAEENFKKSISLAPGRAETHYNLAGLLRDLGRLEQAECLYTKTIELAPENASAVLGRWEVRFDREDFDNALKDAESHNTDAFRACALETLFALGRDDEVQSRLIAQEITNSRNLRISAFSSFFSAQTRRKVPNHFCENPMELIYFSNISEASRQYLSSANEAICWSGCLVNQ